MWRYLRRSPPRQWAFLSVPFANTILRLIRILEAMPSALVHEVKLHKSILHRRLVLGVGMEVLGLSAIIIYLSWLVLGPSLLLLVPFALSLLMYVGTKYWRKQDRFGVEAYTQGTIMPAYVRPQRYVAERPRSPRDCIPKTGL